MEANELRIGNLVYHNDKIIEITSLHPKNDAVNDEIPFHAIYGIKITEILLLKLGFEFRNTDKQYGLYLQVSKNRVLYWYHSKKISLEFDSEDYDNTLFDFDCNFIHQLQNIYFALTGKELIYKNN